MSLPHLPEAQADRLRALHASGDRPALKAYINALRAQQWPLRAIGEPLGLSRSTIQYFEKTAEYVDHTILDIPFSPKAIETAGARTVRWRSHLPGNQKAWLHVLAQQARKVRAQTLPGSAPHRASEDLDNLIEHYLNRMVPVTEIAEAMGVTHRAVKARIERRSETD